MNLVPGKPSANIQSPMNIQRRFLALLPLVSLALNTEAVAQYTLFVKQHEKFSPVVAIVATEPQIAADGKVETAQQSRNGYIYALGQAKSYAPYFITVRSLNIIAQGQEMNPAGVPVDRSLAITAEFETAQPLKNVFLALEVKGETQKINTLIAHEVGGLKPGSPVSVHFLVPFYASLGDCHATLHLFSGGPEVLHSNMPPAQIEHELDLMVQKGIEGVMNAPPQPFIGPTPEYPAALLGKNESGSVTIALGISPTGAVLDPVVKEATLPEFGESALKAIRQWRFLPRIKDGKPVATKVVLPLTFRPPPPVAKE